MESICKQDCCEVCPMKGSTCKGCTETDGHPCGGDCFAAACIKKNGFDFYEAFKFKLVDEINSLGISNLNITDLNLLSGAFVNLEYTLPNGEKVKLLDDKRIYFGNQIEIPGSERCFGVVADEQYILVCEYGCNGSEPEIILYKKR